jgi:tripartite-type tricarboxylate transporter receptor subunit TctC
MNVAGTALRILLLAMAALAWGTPAALADGFPSRPIHLILPYAPGGIIEFVGRTLSQKLGEVLRQPVVVEDRPGAGGIVGIDYVARAAPDGYNIVLVDPAIVTNPTLHKSLSYDIFKDMVAISIVATAPEVLVVAPQLGVKTHAGLLAYGKANPGKLFYASAGIGSTPHLAAEMWKAQAGIEATHVPYKGIGPAFIDVMSGKVQMTFSAFPPPCRS